MAYIEAILEQVREGVQTLVDAATGKLEKRLDKIEARLTVLEGGAPEVTAPKAAKKTAARPGTATAKASASGGDVEAKG